MILHLLTAKLAVGRRVTVVDVASPDVQEPIGRPKGIKLPVLVVQRSDGQDAVFRLEDLQQLCDDDQCWGDATE